MVEQESITEDEAALYDRQIRLWGLDAQRRLRAARVLLVGVGGVGAEIAKNIVLSGIKSLTLLDHNEVTEEDRCCQFLLSHSDIGKNRAVSSLERTQRLNPMVSVTADSDDVSLKEDTFFTSFDVVCCTQCLPDTLYRINQLCHDNQIKFFSSDVFGYYGYMFTDLGCHEYSEDIPKKRTSDEIKVDNDGEPVTKKKKIDHTETVLVKNSTTFSRLKTALQYDWSSEDGIKKIMKTPSTYFIMQVLLKFMEKNNRRPATKYTEADVKELLDLKSEVLSTLKVSKTDVVPEAFASHCFSELNPVCAIVGGVLGQEIIKAVSQKDQPHNNFFFYNGLDGSGIVDKIGD